MTIKIPATCTTGSILSRVKEQIHFDSLLAQAQDVLVAQAAKTWTDKEEHDPGITLLQALCFGVADLAYRHTLPLPDLLTPANPVPGTGIFPIVFGPQQALTCGPVTEDDYRRALLDLHTPPEERLAAPDAAAQDHFGSSVSMSEDGDILAIGAPGKAGGGTVYLFQRKEQGWEPQQPLSLPVVAKSEPLNFGVWISLSKDGTRLAATAGTTSKTIYLFEFNGQSWEKLTEITNSNVNFGFAISFSSDSSVVAVSALQTDGMGDGEVYVYRYAGSNWEPIADSPLRYPGSSFPYSGFGFSLSLNENGSALAVGAPWANDSTGEVCIFDIRQGVSTRQSEVVKVAVGDGVARNFGSQVCLDAEGNVLAVRASGENYPSRSGIYFCQRNDGDKSKWIAPKRILDGHINGDRYTGMGLSGNGAVLALTHAGVAGAGAVYVWNYFNDRWNPPITPILADDSGPGDEFACSVSLSNNGSEIVIGARNKNIDWQTNSGAAYVFRSETEFRRYSEDAGSYQTRQDAGYFYLRDAQLITEPDEKQYKYWYDPARREYLFKKREDVDENSLQEMRVLGGYHLYLVPSRDAEKNMQLTESVVNIFLENNRNLCERVRHITWLEPEDVNIEIVIEVDDDCQEYARVLAQIFSVTEAFVSPNAKRYSAAELKSTGLDNDSIYEGPQLQYGWIPELLPAPDYNNGQHVNISLLANKLLNIEGVRSISKLCFEGADENASWDWFASDKNKYLRLWGEDPFEKLAAPGSPVRLLKRGQAIPVPSASEIEMEVPSPALVHETSMLLPYGLWRRPAQHYPVSNLIPPCYGLQNTKPDRWQTQLHQYMLPYEQIVSDGCQQLAMLPQLLAFDRGDDDNDAAIWGGQWPFPILPPDEIDIPNEIHGSYSDELKTFSQDRRKDNGKELALTDYLLGYFGANRASRILQAESEDEFLRVQHYYLSQITELTYQRANFRINSLSALHRRIAARLGWGAALFSGGNIGELPFYIVEHQSLLPGMPDDRHDDATNVINVDFKDGENILTIHSSGEIYLQPGQFINLIIAKNQKFSTDDGDVISNVLVSKVGGTEFDVDSKSNDRILAKKEAISEAAENGNLFWMNSNAWLQDMSYPLSYVDQSGDASGTRRLKAEPYPATLKVGDMIVVTPPESVSIASFKVTVTEVDPLDGTFIVEHEDKLPESPKDYSWHLDRDTAEDSFSFVVSIVFPKDLLKNVEDRNAAVDWINEIIQDEIPCHISVRVHWLDFDGDDESFPNIYRKWYNNGKPLGDLAHRLLSVLGFGQKQSVERGIGIMKIASEYQRNEVIGEDESEWNKDKIDEYELLYVPPSVDTNGGA
ncbi:MULTISPECIES: FG-GAP repeat protein [unclassified Burkholderia]|uniref:FG-GAP repeat protein n=1 Tax=unclassified Burkholderia TaxID=2613784 RepID=UPI0009E9D3A9|nr:MULTISPECIES: FG-GAP repeat protein [unclassified Burkholderia]